MTTTNPAVTITDVRQSFDEAFTLTIPRLGAPFGGGIFHGIVFKDDGSPGYLLITGPQADDFLPWQSAMDWAAALREGGHDDWTLPDRRDSAVLFANASGAFHHDGYYWIREQHASASASAWGQIFSDGGQGYWHKANEYRAVAVRRYPI